MPVYCISAQSVFGNLLSPANYGIKLIRYTASAARYIIGGASAGFLAAIFLFINGIKHKKLKIILCKEECIQSLVIIIPAFLALIVIGAGNVSESLRYIYNLGPLFILTMALMLWLNKCVTPPRFTNAHPKQEIYLLLLFGLAVIPMIKYDPDYVYPEHKEYNEILKNYKDMPCVCMNNNSNVLLTADLFQLMKFDKIFVSNDTDSEKMKEYIDTFRNPEKLIVYIDLYSVWPDGYDSEQILKELIKNTAYTSYAKVYESFYSETYVLSK